MKKKSAIYTIQHNEQYFLPMWIKYYSQFFAPEDMYIVAHNTSGPTVDILYKASQQGINIVPVETTEIFNHPMLTNQVHTSQRNLLTNYEYVVFSDCDEFIVPTECNLREFIDKATEDAYRCTGYDVMEDKMYLSGGFNKTLITKIPLTYCDGYHYSVPEFPVLKNLEMYHLHKVDFWECWDRNIRLSKEKWDQVALDNRLGFQNFVSDQKDFREMFYGTGTLTKQSDRLKELLALVVNNK